VSRLRLVSVAALPTPRAGFIDCGAAGCEVNAVRLNTDRNERLYLHCFLCKDLLVHDPARGWRLKQGSREQIALQREEAREKYAPQIGAGWEALRKIRKVA